MTSAVPDSTVGVQFVMSAANNDQSGAAGVSAALVSVALGGCQEIPPRSGVYDVRVVPMTLSQISLPVTLVTPRSQRHPGLLVLFATGDDGWFFTSRHLLQHLAESGYTIAAFDSTLVTSAADNRHAHVQPDHAARSMDMLLVRAKRELALPGDAPTVITGFSRGATLLCLPPVNRH